jgi:hypothetical protein
MKTPPVINYQCVTAFKKYELEWLDTGDERRYVGEEFC